MNNLRSVWALVSIILALISIIVFQVRNDADRDNHIRSLEANFDHIAARIEEIDKVGTRMSNERANHLSDVLATVDKREQTLDASIEKRLELLTRRMNDIDAALSVARETAIVVRDRQDNILRRVDVLEKITGPLDVMRNDLTRLAEQQNRILQALDNTYDTLQEALRNGTITRKPMPQMNPW